MPDMKDLERAFGRADAGFVASVNRTLNGLQADRQRRPAVKRTGLRLAAAIALITALLTGTALALTSNWGVLDFLHQRRSGAAVLPQVGEIVQTDVPQVPVETDIARFSVREGIYDGNNFYLIVDVKPASGKYLLLGPDAYPQDPMAVMDPLFEGTAGTISDYARENGKEIIQTTVSVDKAGGQGVDYLLQQDGTLTYFINGSLIQESDTVDLELSCILTRFVKNQDGKDIRENIRNSKLAFTLENTGFKEIVTSIAPAEYPSCGVRIDSITLKGSEMAIYAVVQYTVTDKERYDAVEDGLMFEFLDTAGNRLPDGATSGGGITTEDGVHYVLEHAIGAMESLPREIAVRGFNFWDMTGYETHTFTMR